MLSLPRPPRQERLPGAFHSEDGANARDVPPMDEDTIIITSEPNEPIEKVSATLVDPEEEDRKRQEQNEKDVQEALERQAAEFERNTEVAEVVTGFWCTSRARRLIAIGFLVAIVAIVLGTVLPSALAPEPTTPPTPAPTSPLPGLMELLSSVSFDSGVSLKTPSTPQNKALNWLAGDNFYLDSYSDAQKIQRHILATLYYSTNGDAWDENDGWLSDSDECLWYYGKRYEDPCKNSALVRLNLASNNLNGTIPAEIALLSNSLAKVDFSLNELKGTIPSEVGLLTGLTGLGLNNNNITGAIPTDILMMQFEGLELDNNNLTGTIPTEIGIMTSLVNLELYNNDLTGLLPSEIGFMTSLRRLYLYNNNLTGMIPTEIGRFTSLAFLNLEDNNLSGAIPTEIGLMVSLGVLSLSSNNLTGAILTEFDLMSDLVGELGAG